MPDFDTMAFMCIIVGMAVVYAVSAAIFIKKGKKRIEEEE